MVRQPIEEKETDFSILTVVDGLDKYIRGAYDKFSDFFRMGTFIDSTHMEL